MGKGKVQANTQELKSTHGKRPVSKLAELTPTDSKMPLAS